MNRRDFLATSATALAASTLNFSATSLLARETEQQKRFQKAIKYHMIKVKNFSMIDKLKLIKDLGFEGIEPKKKSRVDHKKLLKMSEKVGIKVHGVINGDDHDLISAIDLAKHYDASSVLVVAGRVDEKHPYDKVYNQTQDWIRKAIPYAEKHNISLLIENVWNNFLLSPLEMARYLDELESPHVGAYFDVGNVVRFGFPDQWIHILGKRIKKLDIKEYSRTKQLEEGLKKGFRVPLGTGDCNWPIVRKALAKVGFQGWATVELKGGDQKYLEMISKQMDQILDL